MNFTFFTFGGAVFWEDVFFYQKWRIQRNCFTKKYRLLDSWDIQRAYGNFEKCQRAFIKYIKSYEITKQQGKMIVLLHGYMDSKNIFKPLWRKLAFTNSTIAALNYPSLFRTSLASAHQLLFFLNHCEDITEVSFVTKGCGNLVLQKAFNLPDDQQSFKENMRIGNIVEINPVEKENLFCCFLFQFRIFRFLLGPMLRDFTQEGTKNLPSLPPQFRSFKIYCDSKFTQFFKRLLKLCHFPVEDDYQAKKDSVCVKSATFDVLKNEEVLNFTVKFISNGKI